MSGEDPFDESRAEVRSLLEQARGALRRLRAYASDDLSVSGQRAVRAAAECEGCLDAAGEEVGLLESVVDALKSRRAGAARRSGGMAADVIAEREDFVESAAAEVALLRQQLRDLRLAPGLATLFRREEAIAASANTSRKSKHGGNGTGDGGDDDDGDLEAHNEPLSMQAHEAAQAQAREAQDAALDRVAFGLQSAGDKAGLVQMELGAQDRDLNALADDVDHVDGKLKQQMRRVDDLLAKMSSKRKCGLIACLVFTAGILLLLVVTM
jgi:hypothetical protein